MPLGPRGAGNPVHASRCGSAPVRARCGAGTCARMQPHPRVWPGAADDEGPRRKPPCAANRDDLAGLGAADGEHGPPRSRPDARESRRCAARSPSARVWVNPPSPIHMARSPCEQEAVSSVKPARGWASTQVAAHQWCGPAQLQLARLHGRVRLCPLPGCARAPARRRTGMRPPGPCAAAGASIAVGEQCQHLAHAEAADHVDASAPARAGQSSGPARSWHVRNRRSARGRQWGGSGCGHLVEHVRCGCRTCGVTRLFAQAWAARPASEGLAPPQGKCQQGCCHRIEAKQAAARPAHAGPQAPAVDDELGRLVVSEEDSTMQGRSAAASSPEAGAQVCSAFPRGCFLARIDPQAAAKPGIAALRSLAPAHPPRRCRAGRRTPSALPARDGHEAPRAPSRPGRGGFRLPSAWSRPAWGAGQVHQQPARCAGQPQRPARRQAQAARTQAGPSCPLFIGQLAMAPLRIAEAQGPHGPGEARRRQGHAARRWQAAPWALPRPWPRAERGEPHAPGRRSAGRREPGSGWRPRARSHWASIMQSHSLAENGMPSLNRHSSCSGRIGAAAPARAVPGTRLHAVVVGHQSTDFRFVDDPTAASARGRARPAPASHGVAACRGRAGRPATAAHR
ncbi:hypothetical protein FQR65_LT20552 [Abscondita terminalis]|nr:hypothetical protein FQR65_LT20552 [Abscondita terminalis]